MKNLIFNKMTSEIKATEEEAEFVAQSLIDSYNTINAQCTSLDMQIESLTKQRIALQPQLEAANSLAEKVKLVLPAPPEVEPPEVAPAPPAEPPPPVFPEPVEPIQDDPSLGYVPDED